MMGSTSVVTSIGGCRELHLGQKQRLSWQTHANIVNGISNMTFFIPMNSYNRGDKIRFIQYTHICLNTVNFKIILCGIYKRTHLIN